MRGKRQAKTESTHGRVRACYNTSSQLPRGTPRMWTISSTKSVGFWWIDKQLCKGIFVHFKSFLIWNKTFTTTTAQSRRGFLCSKGTFNSDSLNEPKKPPRAYWKAWLQKDILSNRVRPENLEYSVLSPSVTKLHVHVLYVIGMNDQVEQT